MSLSLAFFLFLSFFIVLSLRGVCIRVFLYILQMIGTDLMIRAHRMTFL